RSPSTELRRRHRRRDEVALRTRESELDDAVPRRLVFDADGDRLDAAAARRADQRADVVERSMVAAHARHEGAADLDDVDGELLDQMRVFVGGVVEGHANALGAHELEDGDRRDRKSTRLNSSHVASSYAVFCLKKKKKHD